ncbi:hypothetical protein ACJX0J_028428, partial [Zea mays]
MNYFVYVAMVQQEISTQYEEFKNLDFSIFGIRWLTITRVFLRIFDCLFIIIDGESPVGFYVWLAAQLHLFYFLTICWGRSIGVLIRAGHGSSILALGWLGLLKVLDTSPLAGVIIFGSSSFFIDMFKFIMLSNLEFLKIMAGLWFLFAVIFMYICVISAVYTNGYKYLDTRLISCRYSGAIAA